MLKIYVAIFLGNNFLLVSHRNSQRIGTALGHWLSDEQVWVGLHYRIHQKQLDLTPRVTMRNARYVNEDKRYRPLAAFDVPTGSRGASRL